MDVCLPDNSRTSFAVSAAFWPLLEGSNLTAQHCKSRPLVKGSSVLSGDDVLGGHGTQMARARLSTVVHLATLVMMYDNR
jgi:hypothetical protein